MSTQRPPAPTGATDWKEWATQLIRYLVQRDASLDDVLRPAHRSSRSKPYQDGLVMYDNNLKSLVISRGGQWRQIKDVNQ